MKTHYYSLIVKGSEEGVLRELKQHMYLRLLRVHYVFPRDKVVVVVTADSDQTAQLNRWFNSGPIQPPFPTGTLLLWNDMTDEQAQARIADAAPVKRGRKIGLDGVEDDIYYTVIISPSANPTKWHAPHTVSRGMFRSDSDAYAWARNHLRSSDAFEIRRVRVFPGQGRQPLPEPVASSTKRERKIGLDDVDIRDRAVRIESSDGDVITSDLSDFLDANKADPDLCAEVLALSIGESLVVGGGAAPRVRITVRRRRAPSPWDIPPAPAPAPAPGRGRKIGLDDAGFNFAPGSTRFPRRSR
jgi:hypothetical protein